ncbi:unnamed protein product, partial [Discosporangium mesarthrocarpum]
MFQPGRLSIPPPPPPDRREENVLLAFSVTGLRESSTLIEGDGKDGQQDKGNRWGGVKSIMSTFNTVVGDRQELVITLAGDDAGGVPGRVGSPSGRAVPPADPLYQSEQVVWEVQRPRVDVFDAPVGEREETVHFSVPARIPSNLNNSLDLGMDIEGFVLALWICLPRSGGRRTLLGHVGVSSDELLGIQAMNVVAQ